MRRLTMWCGAGLLLLATWPGSPCNAQVTTAGVHVVATAELSRTAVTFAAARVGVAPTLRHAELRQRSAPFAADSSATVSHRGTHALVGAVIGAAVGLVLGTAIDQEMNRKTLNDRNAEPITVHFGGFLLPPLGAIIGAVIGWHK